MQAYSVQGSDSIIAVRELEAIQTVIEKAAEQPGWNRVKLVVVATDNTNVEGWIERKWSHNATAGSLLQEIYTTLGPGRRIATVRVESKANFSDLATRDRGAPQKDSDRWRPAEEKLEDEAYKEDYNRRWRATVEALMGSWNRIAETAQNGRTKAGQDATRRDRENA